MRMYLFSYIPICIALLIFGYGVLVRGDYFLKPQTELVPVVSLTVIPAATPSAEPSATPSVTPKPSVKPTLAPAKIESIFVYPGAKLIKDENREQTYEVAGVGSDVFEWYKSTLKENNFHISTSVLTRSNDKFKGVLIAQNSGKVLNITIEQEGTGQMIKVIQK